MLAEGYSSTITGGSYSSSGEEGQAEDVLAVIVPDVLARRVSGDRSAGLSAKS
jgi:hypothetical protein